MAFGFAAFVLLQFIRPGIPEKFSEAPLDAPPAVRHVLEKDCYSCHSNQRRLSWFDNIVPAYWLVRRDVIKAREHLNFSTLNAKPAPMPKASLYEAVNMMQLGAMPLAQFRVFHREAMVTEEDLSILKAYLAPWKDLPQKTAVATPTSPFHARQSSPAAELNGLVFDPDYKNWKILSFTDRGDNGTFRFILGNDVAVRAARSGHISPWPDGARIAKVAWQKTMGADGLLHPGNFIQVELMEKGSQQYRKTDGWGWGRWRGMALQPYGKDAGFVEECTGCHLPVRADDSVYTLPITAASVRGNEVANNRASLPVNLPYQPLDWSPSTMFVDPANLTIATLFVSDAAQSGSASAVLALVTWSQRDDPHWFGARIPDQPKSVEFVIAGKTEEAERYSRYAGLGLPAAPLEKGAAQERARFILSLPKPPLP